MGPWLLRAGRDSGAGQRKSVEIGPLSAMLPGPLEPAFLDRLFPDKTFGNNMLISIKPPVVREIPDRLYNLYLRLFAAEIFIKILLAKVTGNPYSPRVTDGGYFSPSAYFKQLSKN